MSGRYNAIKIISQYYFCQVLFRLGKLSADVTVSAWKEIVDVGRKTDRIHSISSLTCVVSVPFLYKRRVFRFLTERELGREQKGGRGVVDPSASYPLLRFFAHALIYARLAYGKSSFVWERLLDVLYRVKAFVLLLYLYSLQFRFRKYTFLLCLKLPPKQS